MRARARSQPTPFVVTALISLLTLVLVMAGCSSDEETTTEDSSTTSTTVATVSGAVTVSAAASLTEAFTTIKDDFVEQNPDATVTINFGSSGQLATQIESGAPADVAAFADEAPMTELADGGLVDGSPEVFARNQLVIVTKPGNPTGIEGLADMATAGVVSLCVDTAPCGRFADQALDAAGVTIPDSSITRGQDVKATLSAVSEGDAVAGIVYLTDAAAAGDAVDRVAIPEAENVVASYPIAVVKATANGDAATTFVEYVLGPDGQAVLQDAGFLAP